MYKKYEIMIYVKEKQKIVNVYRVSGGEFFVLNGVVFKGFIENLVFELKS